VTAAPRPQDGPGAGADPGAGSAGAPERLPVDNPPEPGRGVGAAPFELGLRMTLLAVLLDPPLLWFERVGPMLLAGVGLALPATLRARWLWALLLSCAVGSLVFQWPFSDNHDYLGALWCLAVLCALSSRNAPGALAHSARRLLGLSFAFATLWKVALAPDFLDGRFMRVTLQTDGRFENLAVLAGGMSHDDWARNDAAMDDVLSGAVSFEESGFAEPPSLRRLAAVLTAFTVAAEAAVAIAFLWPLGRGPSRLRNLALLGFAATTYSFATVRGFGWLLVSLGAVQAETRAARTAYLVVFALIGLYRAVPWSGALIDWLH
jgi:hypothetical protein